MGYRLGKRLHRFGKGPAKAAAAPPGSSQGGQQEVGEMGRVQQVRTEMKVDSGFFWNLGSSVNFLGQELI